MNNEKSIDLMIGLSFFFFVIATKHFHTCTTTTTVISMLFLSTKYIIPSREILQLTTNEITRIKYSAIKVCKSFMRKFGQVDTSPLTKKTKINMMIDPLDEHRIGQKGYNKPCRHSMEQKIHGAKYQTHMDHPL